MDFSSLSVFGVRHLSPAGAYHLIKYLDEKKPKCVLIEGPSDASEVMHQLGNPNVKPPVAILAYTTSTPVNTILYPLAEYSPELVAIKWAVKHKAKLKFIDLPSEKSVFLSKQRNEERICDEGYSEETGKDDETGGEDSEELTEEQKELIKKREEMAEKYAIQQEYYSFHSGIYKKIAEYNGESDYESYWEQVFEHNLNEKTYMNCIIEHSESVRNMVIKAESQILPVSYAYNLIRESYMKMQIQKAVDDKTKPENIVVVCGAYHVTGLKDNATVPMTEDEFEKMPGSKTALTLMPYSNFRLSDISGYGAGNNAPSYYSMLYDCMKSGVIEDLPSRYLTQLGQMMREGGHIASTANIMESVRLANGIASLYGRSMPILKDLHDAAVACLGHGERVPLNEHFAKLDVGTSIGSLPEGVVQTPVQDDMARELKRLKIEKYKTNVMQELDLDLRENRRVSSKEAAFIDLDRSTFFNRLELLGIHFAENVTNKNSDSIWAEKWHLRWSPETEIEIVEANMKGETIETAAAYTLKEKLESASGAVETAALINAAYSCRLISSLDDALKKLQQMVVDSVSFCDISNVAYNLANLIKYGDIRKVDVTCLKPLLKQFFLRSTLLLVDACGCADSDAGRHFDAINAMHDISMDYYDTIDDILWLAKLKELARRDDRNAKLSGLAFSILLERSEVNESECAAEISRRLSPAVPAQIGAGWFEGLASKNKYALLSRIYLWRELDSYIGNLDEEEFKRSVVFLRKAFSSFDTRQKSGLAELLGDLWGFDTADTAERLTEEFTEEEEAVLGELNDFDFDI